MYQFSTYESVLNGQYEGGIDMAHVRSKGNFGIGTFDSLDGELVAMDGMFFHCSNGLCRPARDEQTLAWAAVCNFSPEQCYSLPQIEFNSAKFENSSGCLSPLTISKDRLTATLIKAEFDFIKLTSAPRQNKPYPSIPQVIEDSVEIEKEKIKGTCVGWFAPYYMGNIKSPGFHFHFIDSTQQIGGHVLEFKTKKGEISFFEPHEFTVEFFKKEPL